MVKVTDRVWYDENPGKVLEVSADGRRAKVDWDGLTESECDASDLVKMTDYEANTAFTLRFEEPVDWYDLPTWIKGGYANEKEMRALQASKWTRSSSAPDTYFYQYTSEGAYLRQLARE